MDIKFTTIKQAIIDSGVRYLGGLKTSHKMELSYLNGTATYCLYLAPSTLSGYNVCPCSKYCKEFCLNGSGQNRMKTIHTKKLDENNLSSIDKSRVKKTKLFFEQKDFFMRWLIAEIKRAQKYAQKNNMSFSVRLNGTSDINILDFSLDNKNILEIFPNIQFYDYTKVPSRFYSLSKYKNYDLTFSFNGHNWAICETLLKQGFKVAVVFNGKLPKKYRGYNVVDGNKYDMRYIDKGGQIIGLTYHKVANNYKDGFYKKPDTKFIVFENDPFSTF